MAYDEFVSKWIGRYLDYDGKYGFQCVDLMRQYVKDVYGLNPYQAIPTTGNAKEIYRNFRNNQYLRKENNTPTNMPQKGDIVFWGTYPFITGFAGHVGIVVEASLYHLIVFNQNYPVGSPCQYRRFSYKGVLGWLHRV